MKLSPLKPSTTCEVPQVYRSRRARALGGFGMLRLSVGIPVFPPLSGLTERAHTRGWPRPNSGFGVGGQVNPEMSALFPDGCQSSFGSGSGAYVGRPLQPPLSAPTVTAV
jgi:hypothetical protein